MFGVELPVTLAIIPCVLLWLIAGRWAGFSRTILIVGVGLVLMTSPTLRHFTVNVLEDLG